MPSTSNNLAERLRETAKDFADDHYLTDLLNEAAAALEQNSNAVKGGDSHGPDENDTSLRDTAVKGHAHASSEREHSQTEECGFDRNASISEDRYVCTCGYREEREQTNSSAQAETPRMNALRAKMATRTMDEGILLETIGEVERENAELRRELEEAHQSANKWYTQAMTQSSDAESDARELWETLSKCGLLCGDILEKHRAMYGNGSKG